MGRVPPETVPPLYAGALQRGHRPYEGLNGLDRSTATGGECPVCVEYVRIVTGNG